jgi:tetratricopeptide (TPR) repeat protein
LLEGALMWERIGKPKDALQRYDQVIHRYGQHAMAKHAWLQKTRLLVSEEQWEQVVAAAKEIGARRDLTLLEKIEVDGSMALGLVEQGQADPADRFITHARNRMEKNHLGESGRIPHEIAQVFYALGEVRRVKSEKIVFDPMPDNFGGQFEKRAQGLLDAQTAYTDAMRANDPIWAERSGFRIGQLYQHLHQDAMKVKPPPAVKSEKDRQLFEGYMRLRYRVLLKKGLKMMDATLEVAVSIGDKSVWAKRTKHARDEIKQALEAENKAIQQLPWREEDLQKLIKQLEEKIKAKK